jgi:hypothetical protein
MKAIVSQCGAAAFPSSSVANFGSAQWRQFGKDLAGYEKRLRHRGQRQLIKSSVATTAESASKGNTIRKIQFGASSIHARLAALDWKKIRQRSTADPGTTCTIRVARYRRQFEAYDSNLIFAGDTLLTHLQLRPAPSGDFACQPRMPEGEHRSLGALTP